MSEQQDRYFGVNEPIVWRWSAEPDRHSLPHLRRQLPGWPGLLAGVAILLVVVWRDFGTDYCLTEKCRYSLTYAALLAIGVIIAVLKVTGLGNRKLDRAVMMLFSAATFSNKFRALIVTPSRLLALHWDGAIDSFSLKDGDVVIQYGNLRIDREDQRGQPLIRNIPKNIQRELFAALRKARQMQPARTENVS